VGCALSEITVEARQQLRRWRVGFARMAVPVVLVFLLLLGTMAIASRVRSKLEALHLLSASRQNCRNAVEFVSSHPDAASNTLIVIDYEDMGLNYVRDILPLDDKTKAKRQKSLSSHELDELLQLAGGNDLMVHNLEWFLKSSATDRSSLLVMNNYERDFIDHLPLKKEIQYEAGMCGEGAWLYSITK
jgi:hypothetical protein